MRITVALPFEAGERMPASARARPTSVETSWRDRATSIVLIVLWLVLAASAALPGVSYYRLPLAARAFSEQHARFAPTGVTGLRLGILGSALMVIGVATYMLRKRWSVLGRFGKLKYWLQFHIFLCTLGPFFVLLHTSFKIGGLVSIAFWSMTLVVASGVFGRYIYARIPKTLNGRFRTRDELAAERAALLREIKAGQGSHVTLVPLIRRERELERQIARVVPLQRIFRYWHLFHLPLALLMLAILAVHVAIAVLFGYAWPF
jgi:hypothetical protein